MDEFIATNPPSDPDPNLQKAWILLRRGASAGYYTLSEMLQVLKTHQLHGRPSGGLRYNDFAVECPPNLDGVDPEIENDYSLMQIKMYPERVICQAAPFTAQLEKVLQLYEAHQNKV